MSRAGREVRVRRYPYLGALGGMGLTAYAGLHVIDALDGGETVWVSAAAGAVGSLAAQIAKLRGSRVIASAGTDEKVAWLREGLGVEAFNYRRGDLSSNLHLMAEMRDQLSAWLSSGVLVHRETVFDDLDQAPHALAEMISGRTSGKTLVSIC